MMTAKNTENFCEVNFQHRDPVKAFAFLWARENAKLTAMAIFDELAQKIESEIRDDIVKGRFGLTYGDWWISYHSLH